MAETNWDDVGRQFADLGRKLQGTWEEARSSDAAADAKEAGDKLKAVLDDVSATVQRVTADPALHEAAKHAGASVADALASSLRQVADLISSSAGPKKPPPPHAAEDAKPEDLPPELEASTDD